MSRHSDDHAPGSTPGAPGSPAAPGPAGPPGTPGTPYADYAEHPPGVPMPGVPIPGQVAAGERLDLHRTTGSTPAVGGAVPAQVHHTPLTQSQAYEPASGDYRATRITGSHAALPIQAMTPYEEPPPPAARPGSVADAGPPDVPGLPSASAGGGEPEAPVPQRSVSSPPVRPPTGATAGSLPPGQLVAGQLRRLSPEQVRNTTFARSPLGRRGVAEDEVQTFTNRLAEELSARDTEIVRLLDENHRLKQAMREWQTERIDMPSTEAVERVNSETAALMARAQQHIDAQLAQTELYCRQREQEAVRRYDEIVRHARQEMREEAEVVAKRYREDAGATYSADQEQVKRQQVYLGALLQSLDALGAHVQATRQAFATEITRVTPSSSHAPASTPTPGDDRALDPPSPT